MPPKVEVDVPAMYRLWRDMTLSRREIAVELGISHSTLEYLASKHKLPKRPSQRGNREMVDPTPEEIAERARECRERHFAARRAEKDNATDSKLSKSRALVAGVALSIMLAIVAGCCPTGPVKMLPYRVTVTRPDGTVDKTFVVESTKTPRVVHFDDGGCLRVRTYEWGGFVFRDTRPWPVSWNLDVEQLAEGER